MMIYSTPRFIKAGRSSYYDCYEREGLCNTCGHSLGIQHKYPDWKNFRFEIREKENYKYCPYCGKPLFEEANNNEEDKPDVAD